MTAPLSLAVAVAVVALGAFAFRHSPLCHESGDHVFAKGDAIFADGGATAYLAVYSQRYRRAAGLCAFPDGGSPMDIRGAVTFYRIDAETGESARHVVQIPDRDFGSSGSSDAIMLQRRQGARLYGRVEGVYERSGTEVELGTLYFEVDTDEGTARLLPYEAYLEATRDADDISWDQKLRGRMYQDGRPRPWWGPAREHDDGHLNPRFTHGLASETMLDIDLYDAYGEVVTTLATVTEWPGARPDGRRLGWLVPRR